MIEKPKQYYDTRRHQLYYQWSESEYFTHQEPIYDRTKGYTTLGVNFRAVFFVRRSFS